MVLLPISRFAKARSFLLVWHPSVSIVLASKLSVERASNRNVCCPPTMDLMPYPQPFGASVILASSFSEDATSAL